MVFLTNNLEWSAASIIELFGVRWQIEVFFKQIKQTLQWPTFWHQRQCGAVAGVDGTAGVSVVAVLAFLSEWSHSFSRLFTLMRVALWKKWMG